MSYLFNVRQVIALALVGLSTTLLADDMDKTELSDSAREAAQQAMLDMQYADVQRCFIINGDAVRPVLPLLVSSDGLPNVAHKQVLLALDDALARGCDINQPDLDGLSPLNTSILQGNIALSKYLLEHGADPALLIDSTHESLNGLDSFGLIEALRDRAPEQLDTWKKLDAILHGEGAN